MADVEEGTIEAALWKVVDGNPKDALEKYEITVEDMQKTSEAVIEVVIKDAKKIGSAGILSGDDLMFVYMLGVFTGARYQEDR